MNEPHAEPPAHPLTDFNLATFFQPLRILRFRRLLGAAERYPLERLRAWQDARLRGLVVHAVAHVPYYRELFRREGLEPGDIRTCADLVKVPPLTKEIVRARLPDLVSDEFRRLGPQRVRTSGSTGTPLEFYADRSLAAAKFALFWRVWNWAGYRIGRRWAVMGGAVLPGSEVVRRVRSMNALFLTSFNLTQETSHAILDALRAFRPEFLRGYPSSLCEWVRFVDDPDALRRLGLRGVSTNSENLSDAQRACLKEAFGCPVQDVYSQWEQVCVIADCERGTAHHQMEYGVMELLDRNDRPVPPGETGEIVGTCLFNRVVPFLRYKTRDLARLATGPCPCGRALTAVAAVDGRMEDVVDTPDGRRIGRLDAAFKYARGFELAQVVQHAPDAITVRLVADPRQGAVDLAALEQHLRDRVGPLLGIRFEFVDRLPREPNGKLRFVVKTPLPISPAAG